MTTAPTDALFAGIADEAAAVADSLRADGIRICTKCNLRPAREREPGVTKGRPPALCQACTDAEKAPRREKAPPSLKITLGTPKAGAQPKSTQLVEAKAKQFAMMACGIMFAVGLRDDAKQLGNGTDEWAKAVGQLGPYEPWLVKLCEGGEMSGRAIAWLGVATATMGLAMPSLLAHGVIPEGQIRDMVSKMFDLDATARAEAAA